MTPLDLRRYRAERLLRRDFAALRAKVLGIVRSQLRNRGIKLDPADLDGCYSQAWHGLYATLLDGEAVENPSAWLVLVTFRRAIDEHRAMGRVGVIEGEDRRSYPRDSGASAQDFAAELDDRVRLRHLFEGMRASLSPRECEAASLCYLQGLSRAEAAERMDISEARMRKLMEGAGAGRPGVAGKVSELLDTIKAGGWCEQQGSLMRAFAFGVLDPGGERHALAVAHCRECPACRAHVASLRGLASVLPLPLLPRLAAGGSTAAVTASATRAAPGGGWSGLGGSLTAKLAVTAVAMLGAGYAVLGSGPHGNPRGPSAHAAPARRLGGAGVLAHSPFALPRARVPTRAGHSNRRTTTPASRVASTHGRPTLRQTPAREFSPERASASARALPVHGAAPASSPGAGTASGEFGLE